MVRAIARQYQTRRMVLVGQHLEFMLYELPRRRPLRWFYFALIGPGEVWKFNWNGERLNRCRGARSLEPIADDQVRGWVRSILWRYTLNTPPRWGEKVSLSYPSPYRGKVRTGYRTLVESMIYNNCG